MSYDTHFSAKVEGPQDQVDMFILSVRLRELPPIGTYMNDQDWLELFYEGGFSGSWYDHEDDMQTLANLYPNLIFTFDGEGEEQGDVWRIMHKGGEVRKWEMPKIEPPQTWVLMP